MAQEQNYQVNYTINVDATAGTRQVMAFAESVSKLTQAKASLSPAVQNIRNMMEEIDRTFRTKGGKKRDYSFKMNIDTRGTEEKLTRVKSMLNEIREMSKGIHVAINAGEAMNSKQIKTRAKAVIGQKALEIRKAQSEKTASASVKSLSDTQKSVTKAIGKINAAMAHMEKERQLHIQTDAAQSRLQAVLNLLNRIKTATAATMNLKMTVSHTAARGGLTYAPLAAGGRASAGMNKAEAKLREKLYANQRLNQQKLAFKEQEAAIRMREREAVSAARRMQQEQNRVQREQDSLRRKALADEKRREGEAVRRERRNAMTAARNVRRQAGMEESAYGIRRRAAINRLQYSKAPSLRNAMPFAYMLNGYMAYGLIKKELTEAVEYANIMETAHSILKVADSDLTTFETRFGQMARYVRQIGVETKFTAIEVGGAVKYLSMAGMNIGTIMDAIRPVTNLALIGDNEVSMIADLATNIMAGYDIKSTSMGSVADILASSVSRSNVNIIEMAESFKMAAGYMKLAGVDFTQSAAAIGILGNMGIKGTMAGTSLRAMATRFAKPTKEAQKTLDRLGVHFTERNDVYGKQVEVLRPLSDIFAELERKGATMADMQAIFGKIAGNAAMMFIKNHDKLSELSSQNKASQGISDELAKVKQSTTKGLWYQATSMFAESFMQSFELLEPRIRQALRAFLSRFNTHEFSRGLSAISGVLLDIFSTLGNMATWMTKNFHWIEPVFITGFAATKLFKLAGSVTNLGVAFGFLGKQAAAASSLRMIGGLAGLGGGLRGVSFAGKRALVSAMGAAGVSGKGAMMQALAGMGMAGGTQALLAGRTASGLFSSQVATGSGVIGAGASMAAIGTGAVAAAGGISLLVAAMGWLAYKTWKVKEAKDAMQEEIMASRKYRYPSIDALYASLNDTYKKALETKRAVNDLVEEKNLEEASGHGTGAFTTNWWIALLASTARPYSANVSTYSSSDAYQDDTRSAILTIAKKDSQARVNAAFQEFGKLKSSWEVGAFIQTIHAKYGQGDDTLDPSLWRVGKRGEILYKMGMGEESELTATKTYDYAHYQNTVTVPEIARAASAYQTAISNYGNARSLMEKGGFDFGELEKRGFSLSDKGQWAQEALAKNATDEERSDRLANYMVIHDALVKFTSSLRNTMGGSTEAAENILKMAGFSPALYSNEPDYNDTSPFNANDITNRHLPADDDGGAGGNYSGTGKLSSAAPKQVIVNITNLLSIETIDLMRSPEGNSAEIRNLKEQMAQALIDVVHDFDASWNG
jgi:TP901 family phage tail tape measure protein